MKHMLEEVYARLAVWDDRKQDEQVLSPRVCMPTYSAPKGIHQAPDLICGVPLGTANILRLTIAKSQ